MNKSLVMRLLGLGVKPVPETRVQETGRNAPQKRSAGQAAAVRSQRGIYSKLRNLDSNIRC